MHKLISAAFVALTLTACGTVEQAPTPELTYGEVARHGNGNGPVDCSLVLCYAVECPAGFERVYQGPHDCCGTCKKLNPSDEGFCRTPSDCDGLIHPMCVGDWSCADNACEWNCDTGMLDTGAAY